MCGVSRVIFLNNNFLALALHLELPLILILELSIMCKDKNKGKDKVKGETKSKSKFVSKGSSKVEVVESYFVPNKRSPASPNPGNI